jgi:rhodanese-related sulfurtransferase
MKLMDQFRSLAPTQKAAVGLVILAVLAVIAGNPYKGHSTTIDPQTLAIITEKEVDHVTAGELARWIIEGRADFRLIDLRTPEEYTAYHVPGAEQCRMTELVNYGQGRNEKIVLMSQGMTHAAQAWFLLRASGYKGVYILFGGMEAWMEEVLYPSLSENASPAEKAAFERRKHVAAFFGGTPMVVKETGASSARPLEEPTLSPPAPPAPTVLPPASSSPSVTKKKKKEGC